MPADQAAPPALEWAFSCRTGHLVHPPRLGFHSLTRETACASDSEFEPHGTGRGIETTAFREEWPSRPPARSRAGRSQTACLAFDRARLCDRADGYRSGGTGSGLAGLPRPRAVPRLRLAEAAGDHGERIRGEPFVGHRGSWTTASWPRDARRTRRLKYKAITSWWALITGSRLAEAATTNFGRSATPKRKAMRSVLRMPPSAARPTSPPESRS